VGEGERPGLWASAPPAAPANDSGNCAFRRVRHWTEQKILSTASAAPSAWQWNEVASSATQKRRRMV